MRHHLKIVELLTLALMAGCFPDTAAPGPTTDAGSVRDTDRDTEDSRRADTNEDASDATSRTDTTDASRADAGDAGCDALVPAPLSWSIAEEQGDWRIGLPRSFSLLAEVRNPLLTVNAFEDPTHQLTGFVVSKSSNWIRTFRELGNIYYRTQRPSDPQVYGAYYAEFGLTVNTPQTMGELRHALLWSLERATHDELSELPSSSSTRFEHFRIRILMFDTDSGYWLTTLVLTPSVIHSDSKEVRLLMDDVVAAQNVARAASEHRRRCARFRFRGVANSDETYTLPSLPITASVRVYIDGQPIARSESDGFMLSSQAVEFFGDVVPAHDPNTPTFFYVVYEEFVR